MFLFKLTLPLLGTATVGAVGTGIYYGVETWKENGATKDKKSRKEVVTKGQTLEGPKPPITSTEESQTLPPSPDSPSEAETPSQPPSLSTVEIVVEETDE